MKLELPIEVQAWVTVYAAVLTGARSCGELKPEDHNEAGEAADIAIAKLHGRADWMEEARFQQRIATGREAK